ncbi:MAG: hypothetical protein IJ737_01780 [Ruminococcus sp.]|nr:hypothetical protein [Ruminococcus sp.]
MIVLWILLGLIALIVILLHFSVTVYVKGGTSGELVFKLKYMCFTLYPRKKKEKKKKPGAEGKAKKKDKAKDKKKKKEDRQEIAPAADQNSPELREEVYSAEDIDALLEKIDAEEQGGSTDAKAEDKPAEVMEEAAAEEQQAAAEKPEEEPVAAEVKAGKKKLTPEEKKALKEQKKQQKAEKKAEKAARKAEKKAGGGLGGKIDGLKAKWEMIKPYIPMGWKYFKKLLKAVRFTKVKVDIVTGKEDAYESALFYGKLQTALFSVLSVLGMVFTLKLKEANVKCVFGEKRLDAEGEVTVKVRPSTMIAIAFCMGVNALHIFLKQRRAKKKAAKARRRQRELAAKKREENGNENAGQTAA